MFEIIKRDAAIVVNAAFYIEMAFFKLFERAYAIYVTYLKDMK